MSKKQVFDKQARDKLLWLMSKLRTTFQQIQHSYKSVCLIYLGIYTYLHTQFI
jgi:hypothetical protein